jgi:hypothetical protein
MARALGLGVIIVLPWGLLGLGLDECIEISLLHVRSSYLV